MYMYISDILYPKGMYMEVKIKTKLKLLYYIHLYKVEIDMEYLISIYIRVV